MSNITVFHKDYCPYCKAAIKLLNEKGLPFHEIEVTNNPVEFANMVKSSKRRTVPQIFVGDIHIGGFDELHAQISNNTFPLKKVNVG